MNTGVGVVKMMIYTAGLCMEPKRPLQAEFQKIVFKFLKFPKKIIRKYIKMHLIKNNLQNFLKNNFFRTQITRPNKQLYRYKMIRHGREGTGTIGFFIFAKKTVAQKRPLIRPKVKFIFSNFTPFKVANKANPNRGKLLVNWRFRWKHDGLVVRYGKHLERLVYYSRVRS